MTTMINPVCHAEITDPFTNGVRMTYFVRSIIIEVRVKEEGRDDLLRTMEKSPYLWNN